MRADLRLSALALEPAALERRRQWARAHGHPLYLWPEVEPAAWRAALGRVERAMAAGLRGERDAVLDDEGSIEPIAIALFTSGTGPLLGRWVEQGRMDAADPVRALLALHLEHGRARAARLLEGRAAALRVLGDAGLSPTVLKGAHTAHAYFPEPGTRPMSDIDVQVDDAGVRAAEQAFRTAGWVEVPGSRRGRPYRSDWRAPGVSPAVHSLLVLHRDDPWTVDLHASLDFDFFGAGHVVFDADRSGAGTLPQPLLTAYLATHASMGLHNLTLIRLAELVLVIRRDGGHAFAWPALLDLLRRAGGARFVHPAFALAERLVPGTVDRAFLAAIRRAATPAMRDVVDGLTPATAQRLEGVALNERFMWAASPMERVRSAGYMLFPTGRGGSLRRLGRIYADRAWRLLRRRVSIRG